ncbi:MAG: DNA adenine methylase [Bacteroidota bacterium]|jgi:DNA adenine methylase
MKTFLKWAGNKSSVYPLIQPYLSGNKLIEPFSGTCSISLLSDYHNCVCNDINSDMINMFQLIQSDANKFIEESKKYFISGNDSERFYDLREFYNNSTDKDVRSYLFLYLNRHCFNGLCRYNSKMKFNVPFGKYNNIYYPEQEIKDFADRVKNFEFKNNSFEQLFIDVSSDTTIYCDPPYLPLTDTADFANYSGLGFTFQQHVKLAELARQTSVKSGCTVLISNHDTDSIRDLYKESDEIISFEVKRTISSKVEKRNKAKELLAIYRG